MWKRLLSLDLRTALSLALIVVTVRLVWVASRTEIGWELLGCQWQDATVGRFGFRPTSIDVMVPAEQANYWLPEIERILGDSPQSAQLVMGAACVLDSPDRQWGGHRGPNGKYVGIPPKFGKRPSLPEMYAAKQQFEVKCSQRCLALAALATQLEPSNVCWWQTRGILQMNPHTIRPRSADWLDVLSECALHDPDNALYDYLAAMLLWNESGAVDLSFAQGPPKDELTVTAKGKDLFEQGLRHFESGQTKKCLVLDEAAWPASAELLAHSHIRRIDQAPIIWGHGASPRIWMPQRGLFRNILRWQVYRAKRARQEGDRAQEAAILRETLRFYDQVSTQEEMAAPLVLYFLYFYSERRDVFAALTKLARERPDLVSKDEADRLIANEQNYRFDATVTSRAITAIANARRGARLGSMVPPFLASFELLSAALLLLLAPLAWALGGLLSREKPALRSFRLFPNLVAWALACGATFVYLGALPARVFSLQVGMQISTVVVFALALAIPAWAVWRAFHYLRRRQFQFTLMWLLGAMAACAVLAALWAKMQPTLSSIAQGIPQQRWQMSGGWIGDDVDLLIFANGSWGDAVIQWLARGGPYFSAVVALLILAVWFHSRYPAGRDKGLLSVSPREAMQRWAMVLRDLARSALVAAACLLIVYLWWVADFVRKEENDYQYCMLHSRTPATYSRQLDEARAGILASEEQIAEIRQAMGAEMKADGF